MDELTNVLRLFAAALESLNIPYAIGGSVASTTYGVVGATLNIDIVARVGPGQAEQLVAALGLEWYADAEQIRQAGSREHSFNVIHTPTTLSADSGDADR